MSRGKHAPEFKTKLVPEALSGERELGAIAAEHSLNPNMLRNRKTEFLAHASVVFEEHGKAERDKMLKTIAVCRKTSHRGSLAEFTRKGYAASVRQQSCQRLRSRRPQATE